MTMCHVVWDGNRMSFNSLAPLQMPCTLFLIPGHTMKRKLKRFNHDIVSKAGETFEDDKTEGFVAIL